MMRTVLVALLSTALTVSTASAQGQQTGTLQGAVFDTSGLALPAVTIVARRLRCRALERRSRRRRRVRAARPAAWHVRGRVHSAGFTDSRAPVTVAVGLPPEVSATLAPAGVTERVDVVAETSSAVVSACDSANYDAAEVDTLATGRTLSAIAELAPGLTGTTPNTGQVAISGALLVARAAHAAPLYLRLDVPNMFNRTPLPSDNTTVTAVEDSPVDALGLPTTFQRRPRFGEATSNTDYPFPREFRVSVGFRS